MTTPLLGRNDIKRLLSDNGLAPRKSLGQNFVVDPNAIDRIVRLANIGPHDHVVEIGTGLASLTLALEASGARVVSFEIDEGLAAVARTLVGERVTIVEQDALSVDLGSALAQFAQIEHEPSQTVHWTLVANLPYNVATPLVLSILKRDFTIDRMMVMVQREVGERFVATPRDKAYGAVSVRLAYFAHARIVGRVAKEVFFPQPKIESTLVEITRRDHYAVDPSVCSYEELDVLVRAGFAQRRKMLRRSLASLVNEQTFACAGLAPTLRAENLDIADWGRLAGCRRLKTSVPSPS